MLHKRIIPIVLVILIMCNYKGPLPISASFLHFNPMKTDIVDDPPVIEIVNPTQGYFHYSGIPLFPIEDSMNKTICIGGFRLQSLQFIIEDDTDDPNELSAQVVITQFPLYEKRMDALYNPETGFHEVQWTNPKTGTFNLSASVRDSSGNTGTNQLNIKYICQPIVYYLESWYLILRELLYDFFTNHRPNAPSISGPKNGKIDVSYTCEISSIDPDGDTIFYYVDWGDESNSGWQSPFNSETIVNMSHVWSEPNIYLVKARIRDVYGSVSRWTRLIVNIKKSY